MSDIKPSTLDQPEVTAFFDAQTNTISYIVKEPSGNACAVIDSVMNMDYAAGRITFESANDIIKTIKDRGLEHSGSSKPMCTPITFPLRPICKRSWAAK